MQFRILFNRQPLSDGAIHAIFLVLARLDGLFLCCNKIRETNLFAGRELENNMSDLLLQSFDAPANDNLPQLRPGDNVTVHLRIVEGKRDRIQLVRGVIIRLRNRGNQQNFTVRRIASNGIGVERTFLLRSPSIEKIEVHRHAHVRRAQLYYLRGRTGKSARLREKRIV